MSRVWSRIKNWLIAMGSPPHFYKWATRSLPWLAGLAVIVFCVGLIWGIGFSPTDYKQGDVYRIIYILLFLVSIKLIWDGFSNIIK